MATNVQSHPGAPADEHGRAETETIHACSPNTLVLGLGNPILRDDAIGILVARQAGRLLSGRNGIVVREASLAGFDLLDLLAGFRRAFIIDAIKTAGGVPGAVYRLLPHDLPAPERIEAVHEINLPTALSLGRTMGMEMPEEIVIYAVEVEDDRTFGETLSPSVAAARKRAALLVVEEVLGKRPPRNLSRGLRTNAYVFSRELRGAGYAKRKKV